MPYAIKRLDPEADEVVLDSRGLVIESVELRPEEQVPQTLEFSMGETLPVLGEAIRIQLPAELSQQSGFGLQVNYHTGPDPSAIMWLEPGMTAGGQHPFMFTQSQANNGQDQALARELFLRNQGQYHPQTNSYIEKVFTAQVN